MKRVIGIVVLLVAVVGVMGGYAEEKSMDQLSKELANPLAQIWNLSFQHNRSLITGDVVDGHDYLNTTLFQPVLPIPLGDKYTAFARPVITILDGPTRGTITGGTPSQPVGLGSDRTIEFGDISIRRGIVGT